MVYLYHGPGVWRAPYTRGRVVKVDEDCRSTSRVYIEKHERGAICKWNPRAAVDSCLFAYYWAPAPT